MGKRTQIQKEIIARSKGDGRRSRAVLVLVAAAITAFLTSQVFIFTRKNSIKQQLGSTAITDSQSAALELMDSLIVPPVINESTDIALLNLTAAPGLAPDERSRIIGESMKTLDSWAETVKEQTWKNHYRYLQNPSEFKSEVEWKMAMMCTVLGQDFKVRYDPSLTSTVQQSASNFEFFSNPKSVFLTGCLGDSRIGTCASLPVLYLAIGRRVGYPMYLVATKGHLFARWDDGKGTRVNLEAANAGGYTSYPDSYYRSWPSALSSQEEQSGGYLINLTAQQAFAIFLTTRAACLQAQGRAEEAIAAAGAAYRLAPNLGGIVPALRSTIGAANPDFHMQEFIHQQEIARLRERYEPMTPNQRFGMPSAEGSFLPNLPQLGIPQPGTYLNPSAQFPQQPNFTIPAE